MQQQSELCLFVAGRSPSALDSRSRSGDNVWNNENLLGFSLRKRVDAIYLKQERADVWTETHKRAEEQCDPSIYYRGALRRGGFLRHLHEAERN